MRERTQERLVLSALLLIAACVFIAGISWGLPSRRIDAYLFGDRPSWTGEQIQALIDSKNANQKWDDAARGADVDVDPRTETGEPVVVNATDADRAEILRRYR